MAPSNTLPMHGNDKTMNLNSLVLANIQASPYFKVHLFDLKTYHQVIDEIYYKVTHLEPWEKGSRKTAGQTGMCGGVRGVGTGGIVSSAFCLLFKLYTMKLTRKQLISVCTHPDSGYIRGLGLMYIRFTQPPTVGDHHLDVTIEARGDVQGHQMDVGTGVGLRTTEKDHQINADVLPMCVGDHTNASGRRQRTVGVRRDRPRNVAATTGIVRGRPIGRVVCAVRDTSVRAREIAVLTSLISRKSSRECTAGDEHVRIHRRDNRRGSLLHDGRGSTLIVHL